MNIVQRFALLGFAALLAAGCSSLPGLRVLTGQNPETAANNEQAVQVLDLVMADKTGSTDPELVSAADRIEAATRNVDVIEIRQDSENDAFVINMLFNPPQPSGNANQDQVAVFESLRRAIELSWQATLPMSDGADTLVINLLQPQQISTLDNGPGFVGFVTESFEIDRMEAAAYLSGTRSLQGFYNLIVDGVMAYESPQSLYQGQPNHPMFMLSQAQAQESQTQQ